jgi:hypothetical protein
MLSPARKKRADEIARDLTQKALDTIELLMDDGDLDSVRLAAARDILDRGWGKPLQATIAIPASRKVTAELMGLDDGELLSIATREDEPIEATFHDLLAQLPDAPAAEDPLLQ